MQVFREIFFCCVKFSAQCSVSDPDQLLLEHPEPIIFTDPDPSVCKQNS
jgi:hypothetical protein